LRFNAIRCCVHSSEGTVISADIAIAIDDPSILLQSFVVPIGNTFEGEIVIAALVPWFDIINLIKRDPNAIYQISPRRWEEIIAAAYEQAGFDEVILTPRSGDGGKDVIAIMKGFAEVRIIDQVKAYKPGHLVKADEVRALSGVLHTDPANKGFVTTTSSFAPRIKDDPSIAPLIPHRLGLRNGEQLVKDLQEIVEGKR
jgi:restriction system protein